MSTPVARTLALSETEWADLGHGPLFISAPATGAQVKIMADGDHILARSARGPSLVVVSPGAAPEGPLSEATGLALIAALSAQGAKLGAVGEGANAQTLFGLLLTLAAGGGVTLPSAPTVTGLVFDFTRTESLLLA